MQEHLKFKYTQSKFHLFRHRLAVLVAQMPVGFHSERPAVFVAQPFCQRLYVHALFQCPCAKQMPAAVVCHAWDSQFPAAGVQRLLDAVHLGYAFLWLRLLLLQPS